MQRVGFECLAIVLDRDSSESARAPIIQANGQQHHGKGSDARFNLDFTKEQPLDCLIDDPDARQQKQACFNECGEVFDFTVAILVVGVRRFV